MEEPQVLTLLETNLSENNTGKENSNVFGQLFEKEYALHKKEEKIDSARLIGIESNSDIENIEESNSLDKCNIESQISKEDIKENEDECGKNKENEDACDENKENKPVAHLLKNDESHIVSQNVILNENMNEKSEEKLQKENMETESKIIISDTINDTKFEKDNDKAEKVDVSKDETPYPSNGTRLPVDKKNTENQITIEENDFESEPKHVNDSSASYTKEESDTFNLISSDTSNSIDLNDSTNDYISNDFAVAEGSRLDTQYDVNELNDDDSHPESSSSNSEGPENECDKTESAVIGDVLVTEIIHNNLVHENVDNASEVSDIDEEFDNDSLDGDQPETDLMKDSLDKEQLEDGEKKERQVMDVHENLMKDSLEKCQLEVVEMKEPHVTEVIAEPSLLLLMSSALRSSVESLKSVASVKSVQSLKNASPKFKRRLRTFSSSSGKRDSGDFTIEIFESKRKPLDSPATQSIPTTGETFSKADNKVEISAKVDLGSADQCQSDNKDNQGSITVNETDIAKPSSQEPIPTTSGCIGKVFENVTNLDNDVDSSDAPPANEPNLELTDTHRKNSDNNSNKTPTSSEAPSIVQSKNFGGGVPQENVSEVRQPQPQGQATEELTKKPTPMAFTIDLGTETEEGTGDQTNKKLEINASISKWAPKHRRNLSLSKVEENKKVEERGKPPVGRPRSGTLGSTTSSSVIQAPPQRRATGYHSEGYFSSDQDDDPRRTELKSPRSPRTPEAKSPMAPQRVMRSASNDSARGASLRRRSPSPEVGGRISTVTNAVSNDLNMSMSLNQSASLLLGKMLANTPEPKRKLSNISGKSEGSGRQCCLGEKKPTVAELIGSYKSSRKDSKASDKLSPTARNQSASVLSLTSCHTFDVNQDEDNVSEAGTYTIGNESPDVEKARSNIDNVFGVLGTATQSDADAKAHNHAADETWESTAANMSRSSPNWIQQWAAQVAEHTKSPSSPATSPHGTKPPVTSPSPESNGSRPRRKLPTVPTGSSPQSSLTLTSPRASDFSDVESASKQATETAAVNGGLPGSPFTSQDSGGDSDIDTLTSYPQTDNDTRLSQAIRNKLKLSNLESTSKPKQLGANPSRTDVNLQGRLKLALRRERSTMSDVGYDSFAAVRQEEHCMQSDSSSETSDNIKEGRKTTENNPPLKYNRAFSLRRARLDEQSSNTADKTKNSKASNAPSSTGRSKAPLTSSKSVQGDYSKHVPSKPQAASPKGPVKDITREDGGRFSLRGTRTASTTSVSKSPPRKNLKKELLKRAIPSRSNSTMSSKEAEFQNWRRRKTYNPMQAAAEGRKKLADKKVGQQNGGSMEERTPSPQLLRSQSFHGTEGMVAGRKWPQKGNHYDEDEPYSLTEDEAANVPQSSPLRRCPTSPHTLSSPTQSTSPARQAQLNAANAARRRASYTLSDDGEGNNTSGSRKTSFDESESEGKSSPMGSTRGGGKAKVKMEALDNLVISTIHSLSVKVRTTSETLLQKLRSQYDEEGDRAALLEEVLAHLTESDQTLTKSQTRSTSRELSGILRNLKKIEHALEVIDQVLVCDDDEEDDLEDEELDGTVCNEWPEEY